MWKGFSVGFLLMLGKHYFWIRHARIKTLSKSSVNVSVSAVNVDLVEGRTIGNWCFIVESAT